MRWLLLAVVLSGAAFADPQLSTYPGAVHTRIGGDVVIRGEHYRLAYFMTEDPLKTVARWFVKGWEGQGYPVTTDGDFVDEATVSAFFTRDGLVRSIVLRRHEGQTLGFTVLKDLWAHQVPVESAQRPRLEGTLWSTALAESRNWHRTTLLAKDVAASRDQLDATWAKAGYTRARETRVEEGGRVLELQKGSRQVVISLVALAGQVTAVDELELDAPAADAGEWEDECGP